MTYATSRGLWRVPPPLIPGAYTLTCLVLTRTNFSHQGDPCVSQRDVESNVLFQPKLLSLPGYECELGDVDCEVTV